MSIASGAQAEAAAVADPVRQALTRYFDAEAARNLGNSIWPDACRYLDIARKDRCDPLVNVPFGRPAFGYRYVINDMQIWRHGTKAVASVHSTHFADDPEGKNIGERSVCLRQLELESRHSQWRVSGVGVVFCNSYATWRGMPL